MSTPTNGMRSGLGLAGTDRENGDAGAGDSSWSGESWPIPTITEPSPNGVLIVTADAVGAELLKSVLSPYTEVICVMDFAAAQAVRKEKGIGVVLCEEDDAGLEFLTQMRESSSATWSAVIFLTGETPPPDESAEGEVEPNEYLRRPFRAREVLARVATVLDLARTRREVPRQLRQLLDTVSDGFIALDENWTITYVNQHTEDRLLSLRKVAIEVVGKNFWEEFPEALGTPLEQQLRSARENQRPSVMELYSNRLESWLEFRCHPSPHGVTLFFRDVSDAKNATIALKDREERLRHALRAAHMGSWRVNLSTGEATHDSSLNRILMGHEVTTSQFTKDDRFKLVHPDDEVAVREAWEQAIASKGFYLSEFRLRREDGEVRWLREQGRVLVNDGDKPDFLTGVTMDVTDQKAVEQKLKDSLSERRRAVEVLEMQKGRLEMLSQIAGELLRASLPQSLLRSIFDRLALELRSEFYWNYLVAPEESRLVLESSAGLSETQSHDLEALNIGQSLCGMAAQSRDSVVVEEAGGDSKKSDMLKALGLRVCVCNPLQIGTRLLGTLSLASATREPFSDEEIQFMRTVCDLVAASMERARLLSEVSHALDSAERASRAKDDFIAALSHELRTPLNPVLLLASDGSSNPDLPEAVRNDFGTISKHVALEARLIDDLLDLTRITRGKLVLEKTCLDAHVVLQDAINTVRGDLEEKQIDLVLHFEAGRSTLSGDAVRLQQVFWNVIKNSVKFTPTGGRIEVSTTVTKGDKFEVKITDSGIGMTAEEIHHIFDAFAQGEHAGSGGSHRFGGLGLGLTITRMLVELHAGTIRAESSGRDQGATFFIDLPLFSPTASTPLDPGPVRPAGQQPVPPPLPTGQPVRILVVEDHEPTRTALAYLLRRRHYEVSPAASMAEALALAEQESFGLVISDIGLPDGSGHDLMKELGQRFGLKGIALTGYGSEDDIARSEAAGFLTHLTKPVRVEALEVALATVAAAC